MFSCYFYCYNYQSLTLLRPMDANHTLDATFSNQGYFYKLQYIFAQFQELSKITKKTLPKFLYQIYYLIICEMTDDYKFDTFLKSIETKKFNFLQRFPVTYFKYNIPIYIFFLYLSSCILSTDFTGYLNGDR